MDALTPTPAQMRLLHAGFWCLGYVGDRDRPARLAAASELLGLEEQLHSFSDLRAGQVGFLLGCLRRQEVPGQDELRGQEGVVISVAPPVAGADEMALRALVATVAGWCVAIAILVILECRAIVRAMRLALNLGRDDSTKLAAR